jgi:hypothetical protein
MSGNGVTIRCGWCGGATRAATICERCGHEDPSLPYVQRGATAPRWERYRLAAARLQLEAERKAVTIESLAEVLEVSPRTVRRWQEMAT